MRLKSVELFGFKSFPDRTVITFDDGVTAILGPNGCGKSNVVDAIKWVLGEKSAKNLRGEEMLDVIFSGCATRHPSGMAEVKLLFDNTDRSIPLDYNEVCIGRRLYRSKESHYFINNSRCRLKEIRELLLDSAIGTSAYSVIEQGRVEALLHAKPADRRAVFEEAAGIAKFKIKRKEILSRLDRGEQMLLRVNDRVEEKERQIKKVSTQAANARRHRRLSEERDAVRTHLYRRQWQSQNRKLREYARRKEELENELDREQKTLAELNTQFADLTREESDITGNRDEVMEAASKTQEELADVQLRQADIRNRIETLTAEISRGNERRNELNARLERLTAQENETRASLESARIKSAEMEQRFSSQDQHRQNMMTAMTDVESAVTELRNRTIDLNSRRQRLAAEAARLEAAEQSAAERRAEMDARLEKMTAEEHELGQAVAALDAEYQTAAEGFGAKADRLDALRTQSRDMTSQAEQLLREERALESERASKTSRKATLEDLENSFAGAFEGVRNIMTASRNNSHELRGVVGMALDLMTVPQNLAMAVETILGGQAQDVVVETARDAQACIEYLKRNRLGRATFLPMDRIQPRRRLMQSLGHIPGVVGEAVDLVSFDRRYATVMEHLLAGVLIVDNLSLARELSGREARGIRIVTVEGDVINPSGAMTGGHGRQSRAGLVQRKAELDALVGDVAGCERRLAEKAERRRQVTEQVSSIAREASELERELAEAGRAEAGLKQTLAGRRGELERARRNRAEAEAERENLLRGDRREELEALRRDLSDHETQLSDLERVVTEKTEEQHRTRALLDSLGAEFAMLSGERSEALFTVRELERRLGEMAAELGVCREELSKPGLTSAEAEEEIAGLRRNLEELNGSEEELLRLRDERRSVGVELSERLIDCRNRMEAFRQRERDCQTQNSRLREGVSELERGLSECAMHIENVRRRASEELQLEDLSWPDAPADIEDVMSEDGGMAAPTEKPVEVEEAGAAPEWAEWEDELLQTHIEELSQKIRNIGTVNPEAIDELAELEASAEFLRSHKEEQEEATASMRAAIDRLNEESSTRFQETFAAVRTSFQHMFMRLFDGGQADLILEEVTEEGADPLDAGIDIFAQPPGKEPKSISLLSGGEKALCAVALLFALFRSKPSPFCILDEVDGPLDESNIDRFMGLVHDFTDETQFIIITHSQLTMGKMDSIWGVSQVERGISRVLSLKYSAMEEMSADQPQESGGRDDVIDMQRMNA